MPTASSEALKAKSARSNCCFAYDRRWMVRLSSPSLAAFVVKRLLLIFVLFLIAAGAGLYIDWNWKRPLWPRGGRYFFHRVELPVPSFRQSDERWSDDPLGGLLDSGTIGGHGAAAARGAIDLKVDGRQPDQPQWHWVV